MEPMKDQYLSTLSRSHGLSAMFDAIKDGSLNEAKFINTAININKNSGHVFSQPSSKFLSASLVVDSKGTGASSSPNPGTSPQHVTLLLWEDQRIQLDILNHTGDIIPGTKVLRVLKNGVIMDSGAKIFFTDRSIYSLNQVSKDFNRKE